MKKFIIKEGTHYFGGFSGAVHQSLVAGQSYYLVERKKAALIDSLQEAKDVLRKMFGDGRIIVVES